MAKIADDKNDMNSKCINCMYASHTWTKIDIEGETVKMIKSPVCGIDKKPISKTNKVICPRYKVTALEKNSENP